MHAFATAHEPGGTRRPAGGPVPATAPSGSPWARGYAGFVRVLKGMAGLDAYDRYLRHHRVHHVGEPPLGEAEFWRCRWDDEGRNPKSRCC